MSPSETTPLLASELSPARPTSPSRSDQDTVQIEVEHPLGGLAANLGTARLHQLVTHKKDCHLGCSMDRCFLRRARFDDSGHIDVINFFGFWSFKSDLVVGICLPPIDFSYRSSVWKASRLTRSSEVEFNRSRLFYPRFLAGCGGGGIMTTSSIIATDLFRLDQRGLVQGFANICFGLGAALGGPLGGWIADTMGWRFAFLAQVPLLIIATILVASFVDYKMEGQVTSKAELARRIDYRGSIALIWMIGALLLSLSFKSNLQYEWSDPRVYGNFIGFLVGLGVFIYIESTVPEPVLPLRLLKFRTPLCSVGISFFTSMIVFSVLYMYPLWFETVKLSSPTEAGLHLIPNSIALSIGSLAAGGWILKTGQHKIVIFISSALLVLGSLLMLFRLDTPLHEWIDIIPNGLGFSASTTAVLSKSISQMYTFNRIYYYEITDDLTIILAANTVPVSLIASVSEKDMAVCTGLSYLFRYNGVVIGVAAVEFIL
ncbi:hypothetical protein PSHT_15739 [Puccinia striiformis]|uniref:Major facilitator superfamily (MFS) profile domain-containing protein n=1 Tax=Puccinia striiformis TaxID=27350 RepID=A0A2S4UDS3_9BASI|nr:hypothetical protein PSHT_15739 [Puccinia striiformis]